MNQNVKQILIQIQMHQIIQIMLNASQNEHVELELKLLLNQHMLWI